MKRPVVAFVWLLLACGLLFTVGATAASPPSQTFEPTLRVVTKEIKPFVFYGEDGELTGFSIDLWDAIMERTELGYEWIEVETVTEQIETVQIGQAEAAIAAVSMTAEREEVIDFSYPYFDGGLRIMTLPRRDFGLGALSGLIFSGVFLQALGGVLILIIIIGHIVWLVERRHNPDFPSSYFKGVWEGIWWSAVTLTTVGYGDKTPTGALGRLIGLLWMFAGLFVIANFTAAVTTQLTLNELQAPVDGVEDLPGKKIVTVEGSTSAEWLTEKRLPYETVENIDNAYNMLESRQVDAIVYDGPVLMYKMATSEPGKFLVVGDLFSHESYAIVLPTGSPYENDINQALLELFEDGTYDAIYDKWYETARFE